MYHEEFSFEKKQSEREGNYRDELVWILMKKLHKEIGPIA